MKVIHSFGTAYIAQQLRLDSCEFASHAAQFEAEVADTGELVECPTNRKHYLDTGRD